jgi:ribosomal protein S18 acetylase RimI-like enzyme
MNERNFRIRSWTADDLPAVKRLMDQLARHIGEENEISLELMERHFREMEKLPQLYDSFVYESDGNIVGFISVVYYRSVFHRMGTALINELVVDVAHRGRGIGQTLLRRSIDEAKKRGMDELEVGVVKENTGAQRFYKQNGFEEEYLLLGMEFDE